MSITWPIVLNAIEKLRQLPDDWDGEGSTRPSDQLIDEALKCAACLQNDFEPAHDVYIAGDDIVLEWQDADKTIERICIEGVGVGSLMVSYPDKPSEFGDINWSDKLYFGELSLLK